MPASLCSNIIHSKVCNSPLAIDSFIRNLYSADGFCNAIPAFIDLQVSGSEHLVLLCDSGLLGSLKNPVYYFAGNLLPINRTGRVGRCLVQTTPEGINLTLQFMCKGSYEQLATKTKNLATKTTTTCHDLCHAKALDSY